MKKLLPTTRRPDLTVHHNGRIDIAATVTHRLDIHPGDILDIMTDGHEYYLYIAHRAADITGRHHAACHPTKKGSSNCRLWSRTLARALLHAASRSSQTTRLITGDTITLPPDRKAITIITKYPLP